MEGNAQEYEELIKNLSSEFLCVLLPVFCSRVVLGKAAHNKRIEEALKSRLDDPFVAQAYGCWTNLDSKEESGLIKVFIQHKATDRGDLGEKDVPVAGVVLPFLPGYQITSTQTVLHFKSKTKPAIVRVNAMKLTDGVVLTPRKPAAISSPKFKNSNHSNSSNHYTPVIEESFRASFGLEEKRFGPDISTFRVVKWEDVRQDALILQCMRLFNSIWKRAGLKDVHSLVYKYRILPLLSSLFSLLSLLSFSSYTHIPHIHVHTTQYTAPTM